MKALDGSGWVECNKIAVDALPDTRYTRSLRRAAEILGSESRLAEALRVPLKDLMRWLAGAGLPPLPVYVATLQILSEHRSD